MNKKFTLIELLVVVAIIGILAAMILPALGTARDKAQQKTCTNNLKQVGTAMIMYFSDGSETAIPPNSDNYLRANDGGATDNQVGDLWDLSAGSLSCNAKRTAQTGNEKVYALCTGIASANFDSVEDPQTRVATDSAKNGTTAGVHESGGKANVLAGDGHVEATAPGMAQNDTEL